MAKKSDDVLDLDSLLHPAAAFDHPKDVANDPDLSLNEKRAILASWASDVCSVESTESLDPKAAVKFDEIVEVLRELDRSARLARMPARNYRRVLAKLRGKTSGGRDEGSRGGSPLQ